MSEQFNIPRDQQGERIEGAINPVGARWINNSFAPSDESWIVLQPGDQYLLFLPQGGIPYYVSYDTIGAFPSTPGAPMVEFPAIQNPAFLDVSNWRRHSSGERRIYIQNSPLAAQVITTLVFKGRNL